MIDYTGLDLDKLPEPQLLPKGAEVKVRIVTVRTGESEKSGAAYFAPVYEVLGEGNEMVPEFSDFFWILDPEKLDRKTFARAAHQFKLFAKCFGLDYSRPFDLEELIGLEGWVIVGIKESPEYGQQNVVAKYL